jgi:hypothetical protein
MEIETVNDFCEHLADLVGVYGGCKHAEKGDGDCPEKLITCCRIGFVTEISERIWKAVENEKMLSAMDQSKYGMGQSNIPHVSGSASKGQIITQLLDKLHEEANGKEIKEYNNMMACSYGVVTIDIKIE